VKKAMRSRPFFISLLAVIMVVFLAVASSTVRAQIAPLYPENGATVSDSPTFEWSDGGYSLFGFYLYLPINGRYRHIPAERPAWRLSPSISHPWFEYVWPYVDEDTWAAWKVVGVNRDTGEWEVAGPWWFKKNICPDPTILPAGVLDPTGCETYIGAHPLYPEETDPAYDVIYEFCDDGTARKQWDPDPPAGTPGPTDGTGTWAVDPGTKELTIVTAAAVMGALNMETTDVYDVAFTYDGGAKLDLYSAARVPSGNGSCVRGNYERHSSTVIVMSGMFDANVDTSEDTTLTVTDGAWESEMVTEVVCTGSPVICGTMPPGETTGTDGTFVMPGELYDLDGMFICQAEDTLVLERQ